MPSTDSEITLMEDPQAVGDKDGSLTNIMSSVPPPTGPCSTPLPPSTARQNFAGEAMIEAKAVSMASNDCSSSLASPAEASPAKPAVTSPTTVDGTVETSPTASRITSASDSLTCTGTSLVNMSESLPPLPDLPSKTFGAPDPEADFPAVLTFEGISVSLENDSVWKQFHSCGTEMIITKPGRRMFPYCRYRLAGLDPNQQYSLVLSIAPSDTHKYRWATTKWEVQGPAENQTNLMRAFPHHLSPCRGSDWMNSLVSFYKLKLTNNPQDQDDHILLHSMHRYIPRLHVIPVPDGPESAAEPTVMGLESIAFTFPQTEFMAVTTYQNFRITQLKINHNPFAKGFRFEGNNSRLTKVTAAARPVMIQPSPFKPVELDKLKQEAEDVGISAPLSNKQETKLILKPIMSSSGGKDKPYVPCIRGKHALGELMLVQKRPCLEPKEGTHLVGELEKDRVTPGEMSKTPTSTTSTPRSSPGYRKRRKRINRRWANSRGREWKAANAFPTVVHRPSSTVATQPELDDVEGLLFASFCSKEALETHVRDMPASNASAASPVMTWMQLDQKVDVAPETDEEKLARLEAVLLQDFQVLKHRQVIHPVLQQVGLKLSSLDPTNSIDLRYLGVLLPLPPPQLPKRGSATSAGEEGFVFVSRTGKTSDITKIKGWRNKFIRKKEVSPSNCDGPQKNLSAFCSNLLDKYLESEGQYISERAAAFSTNPEGPVAYQLPDKSSSYVKTLDSVLKQNAAARVPVAASRPCPLSHKPPSHSTLTSSAPPLAGPVTPEAQFRQQPASSRMLSEAALMANAASGLISQRGATQSQGMSHRPWSFTKPQLKLLQMETGALNEGLSRTQLTPDRLSMALSAILTKEMQPSQLLKTFSQHPTCQTEQPVCGQDFCRLGCVCSSLQQLNRGPLHCRRPECMFGCSCFKRKITKLLTAGEGEQQIEPVYSFTNMDHANLPRVGSHGAKLWDCKIDHVDPEPLFTPKSAPLCMVSARAVKRKSTPCPPPQIREEDKDPVYRYLESMMTCARVREFNSRPPEVSLEPKILQSSTPNASVKAEETAADSLPRMYYRTFQNHRTTDNAPLGISSEEREARKQIEIQSLCQWKTDRKKVLEALFRRSKHDRLSKRFYIGPYRIRPVAKIFMKKPSGSLVTYRVNISQPSQASDDDKSEDSEEEKHPNRSLDLDMDAEEEEDDQKEDPVMVAGVTPFLRKVLPAGRLRAMTKPVGCKEAYGLVQVNSKFYNHARVLLGGIGSLHPANRLAAYITGRLHASGGTAPNSSQKPDPMQKVNSPDALPVEGARTAAPPTTVARTTDLKTPVQPPVQIHQPDSWRNGPTTLPQHSQRSSTTSPSNPAGSFPKSSATSNVSLTVSPSLKTPSFLEQSGTYSFRICPPDNQIATGQSPPGVALPGGFTLIQLPKHGSDGATQQPGSATSPSLTAKSQPSEDELCNVGHLAADSDANLHGLDTFTRADNPLRGMSAEPGSSAALMCKERTDEKNKANPWKVSMNLVASSEDSSSEFSDNCGEDEMLVDVETVEEASQGLAINRLREEAKITSTNSRDSSDDFGSARGIGVQDQEDDGYSQCKVKRKRNIHSVLERQRRTEQRQLFDKLQVVLQSDPKAPRLRLLSLARKEIQNLVEAAKFMENQKERLLRTQSFYVKKLSYLSGKSEEAVREKLKEIYDKQKVKEKTKKWVPFYSQLLQSRAALLQDTAPQPAPQSTPQLPTEVCVNKPPQPVAYTVAAQNNVDPTRRPLPRALPVVVSSPAQVVVAAPSQQTEKQPGDPQAPAQVIMANVQAVPQLQVTSGPDRNSPGFTPLNVKKSSLPPPHTLTLPLIRSKNGRLILPSTIKPCGQGYYTLMVLNPKQNGEKGEAKKQPADVDLQKSLVKSEHPIEASHALEKNATVPSINSAPTHLGVKAPLVQLGHLNKSIFVPALAVAVTQNSQESAALAPKTTDPPSSEVSPVPASADPDGSPGVVRRGRGRPRKHPVVPVSENGKPATRQASGKTVSDTETSVLVKGSQIEKSSSEATNGVVGKSPMPVKRGRGRPRKYKQAKKCHTSDGSAFWSNKNLDTRLKLSPTVTRDGGARSSRPLTRGSLGKDFPSEKKRSWIDVEKELEPELESE